MEDQDIKASEISTEVSEKTEGEIAAENEAKKAEYAAKQKEREENSLRIRKDMITALEDLKYDFQYWKYIAEGLKMVPCTWVGSAGTDGKHLFYDERWCDTLTHRQKVFLWIHEIFHIAARHLYRMPPDIWEIEDKAEKAKTLRKWNAAADHALHQIVKPLTEVPDSKLEWIPDALWDVRFKNMSMEDIFPLLEDPPPTIDVHIYITNKNVEGGVPLNDGKCAVVVNGKGEIIELSEEMKQSLGKSLKDLKEQLDQDAEREELKSYGLDGGLSMRKLNILEPNETKESWRGFMASSLIRKSRNNYSYRKIHRGWFARTGMVVPTLYTDDLEGWIAIDVSGSVSDELYQQFGQEIESIRGQLPETTLNLIWFSHIICRREQVLPGESIDWTCPGRGGTNFIPIFEEIDKDERQPDFLIVLTDADGQFPTKPPEYGIVWCVWGSSPIPAGMGERIQMQ